MGIDAAIYQKSLHKLFPEGEYWDKQFADAESDVSLFCRAKLPELVKFRERIEALQKESVIETTTELIADWERVLLGYVSVGLDITQRRILLKSKRDIKLNRAELQKIADVYGLIIKNIVFPYRPAFFGHTRYNHRAGSPAVFSVLRFDITGTGVYQNVWQDIQAEFPPAGFGRAFFGQKRIAYFPASYIKKYVYQELARRSFGYCKCGQTRLYPSPTYKIKSVIENRLRRASFGFGYFGRVRLVYSPIPRYRAIVAERMAGGSFGFARAGHDRLMYTTAQHIKRVVYNYFRSFGAGGMRFGTDRLFYIPRDLIMALVCTIWRTSCFRAGRFGIDRLAYFTGGFSTRLLPANNIFSAFTGAVIQAVVRESRTAEKSDAKIVNAIIADNGIMGYWDGKLINVLLREDGLLLRNGYCAIFALTRHRFFPRMEHLLVNRYIRLTNRYMDFEQAIKNKLLANQTAYFNYEGA